MQTGFEPTRLGWPKSQCAGRRSYASIYPRSGGFRKKLSACRFMLTEPEGADPPRGARSRKRTRSALFRPPRRTAFRWRITGHSPSSRRRMSRSPGSGTGFGALARLTGGERDVFRPPFRCHTGGRLCASHNSDASVREPFKQCSPPPRIGGAHVSELRSGSPSVFSQWLTVTLSWVNSPVQINTPIPISTRPPAPITTA
jgi:hypothetical protein